MKEKRGGGASRVYGRYSEMLLYRHGTCVLGVSWGRKTNVAWLWHSFGIWQRHGNTHTCTAAIRDPRLVRHHPVLSKKELRILILPLNPQTARPPRSPIEVPTTEPRHARGDTYSYIINTSSPWGMQKRQS